ncbi:MAG TPA: enoyl-CoA hydratase/isomerase family protein [Candidatus Binataceae bacterium]|jgi:enoyl-CoA hydratase|nr:enoyl-CoA hydratase/isomerase family protein [Candidatus Binataceae bacterium]
MPGNFLLQKDGAIATLSFNRPERRNCMNVEVMLEMERILLDFRDDRNVRAIVITGAGPAFSAGADVSALKGVTDPAERQRIFRERGRRLPSIIGRCFEAMSNLDQVVIGAVNGYAVGGGWAIALGCDLVLAAEDAEFWVPEVDLGVPFSGFPVKVLAARVGPWRAKEIAIGCRHYKAPELYTMGLVNRVVPRDELMAEALKLAREMAGKAPRAVRLTKSDINSIVMGIR